MSRTTSPDDASRACKLGSWQGHVAFCPPELNIRVRGSRTGLCDPWAHVGLRGAEHFQAIWCVISGSVRERERHSVREGPAKTPEMRPEVSSAIRKAVAGCCHGQGVRFASCLSDTCAAQGFEPRTKNEKGLHDCNSPMCTLSQNGYGGTHGSAHACTIRNDKIGTLHRNNYVATKKGRSPLASALACPPCPSLLSANAGRMWYFATIKATRPI